jgi:hypothetical protein
MGYGDSTIGGRVVNVVALGMGCVQILFSLAFLFGQGVQKSFDQVFPGVSNGASKPAMGAIHGLMLAWALGGLQISAALILLGLGGHDALSIARLTTGCTFVQTALQLLVGSIVKHHMFKPLKAGVAVTGITFLAAWAPVFLGEVPVNTVVEELVGIVVVLSIFLAAGAKYKKGQWSGDGLLEMDEEEEEDDE